MLKVKEIFKSLNGECNAFGQGSVSTFIRLAGCNLNCSYCDVERRDDGVDVTITSILSRIKTNIVTITGGEPFLQRDQLQNLISALLTRKNKIVIETNGSLPLLLYSESIRKDQLCYVIDYKSKQNFNVDVKYFTKYDYIKFVVKDLIELESNLKEIEYIHRTNPYINIAVSSVMRENFNFSAGMELNDISRSYINLIPPQKLFDFLIEFNLDYILYNVQLHKYLKMR